MEYLIVGLVLIAIIGIFREVTCWYLKTTRMVELLGEIRDELRQEKENG